MMHLMKNQVLHSMQSTYLWAKGGHYLLPLVISIKEDYFQTFNDTHISLKYQTASEQQKNDNLTT